MNKTLYAQWVEACKEMAIPVISFDFCCRLMAIVYVLGGGNECVIYNDKMKEDILYAQDKLHIYGTGVVEPRVAEEIRKYSKELEDYYLAKERPTEHLEWVKKIMERYGENLKY